MDVLISIVIPLHNSMNYLDRCINNILRQVNYNIELLLIDDGSTDESGHICEFYHKNDKRIKYFRQKNLGVSHARNKGIETAKGKYIIFHDSDDYLDSAILPQIPSIISNEIQLGIFNFNIVNNGKTINSIGTQESMIINIEEYYSGLINPKMQYYYGVVWNKLYDLDVIRKNDVRFNDELTLCEDIDFNLNYLQYIDKINLINMDFYNYEQSNTQSLVKIKRPRGDNWKNMSAVYQKIKLYYTHYNQFDKHKSEICNFILNPIIKEIIEIVLEKNGYLVNVMHLRRFCRNSEIQNIAIYFKSDDLFERQCIWCIRKKRIFLLYWLIFFCNKFKLKNLYFAI